jgi:hypothetical protein
MILTSGAIWGGGHVAGLLLAVNASLKTRKAVV